MGTVLTQPQPQHEGTIFASPGLQYWTWSQLPRCLWCSWSRCVTWCASQFSSNIGQRSSSDQCSSVSGVTFTCLRCVRCEWPQAQCQVLSDQWDQCPDQLLTMSSPDQLQ